MSAISSNTGNSNGWARWISQALFQHDHPAGYFQPFIQLLFPQWSTDHYRAQIREVRKENDRTFSLVLKPGSTFADHVWEGFRAGQCIELFIPHEGALLSRFFSISSSPALFKQSGLIELTIRIQEDGRLTPWMAEHLKAGKWLNLSAATGQFVIPQSEEPLLMIAGGSGITPFRSMLSDLSASASGRPVTLMYYSRHEDDVLFRDEFAELAQQHDNITIHIISSDEHGQICAEHLSEYCPDFKDRRIFLCGPAAMTEHTAELLLASGVAAEKTEREYFHAVPLEAPVGGEQRIVFSRSDIVADTSETQASSLLEMAEEAGLKPLSGCRLGVCHQCICKKSSGVVMNTRTGVYSDNGQEEIQLCISAPVSDVVLDL